MNSTMIPQVHIPMSVGYAYGGTIYAHNGNDISTFCNSIFTNWVNVHFKQKASRIK